MSIRRCYKPKKIKRKKKERRKNILLKNLKKENWKRVLVLFTAVLTISLTLVGINASSRKLITKSASGAFCTNNMMRYSFNASAGLTYSGSTISAISDLAFSNSTCTSSVIGGACSIIPTQKK
ncbi:MAG: hypothetical protein EOM50_02705 [Erysipelotrichia bacterium]|nr:hypothetical protein [Erysipelotrichia bacterium]